MVVDNILHARMEKRALLAFFVGRSRTYPISLDSANRLKLLAVPSCFGSEYCGNRRCLYLSAS